MPLVEEEVGQSLSKLIEHNVSDLKRRLDWKQVTDKQGHWLLQAVFWLVSGKILHDKQVQSFERLNLQDVEQVFDCVGSHYGTEPLTVGSKEKLLALEEAARSISQFSSLILTTTEALAYVYENTLISKETRSALGTHSTPSFLVDYVVGNLADWVAEIPVDERSVYEPACGHAAFLVSAMRLLTELLPAEKHVPKSRGPYLRSRLHGTDVDPFALELARLSLTLTDIPNPDGWDLKTEDMFIGQRLADQAQTNTIFLANPPFDNFTPQQEKFYAGRKSDVRFASKASEMLWRTLPHVPDRGVVGIVVPQTFLHTQSARDLRECLLRDFELREISLFPDKVFSFSDAETAIILARKRQRMIEPNQIRYLHIRERELASFRSTYRVSDSRNVPQSRFLDDSSFSLRVPDLEEIWDACKHNRKLIEIAAVGQGFTFTARQLPRGTRTYSAEHFPGAQLGFLRFDHGVQLHELPKQYWMNLDPSVISAARSGTTTGTPQILLNYARASRGPWRLKALIDKEGRPLTSNFIAVRPKEWGYSLDILWAVLNSPIANAYAFSYLSKRHNIVGNIRQIPFPPPGSLHRIRQAASVYLEAASSGTPSARLQKLLFAVDREVLHSYGFPLKLEQSLLTVFTDWERVGVPFRQDRYLPQQLLGCISFAEFLEFEDNWPATNRERGNLIDKNISGALNEHERARLQALQTYAEYHLEQVSPRPTGVLEELEEKIFNELPVKDKK